MLRIAVIGAGRIGQVHAATVANHPDAELVLVCDPVIAAAERLAAKFNARAAADAAEAFAADDVDAVVIGSPTPLHPEHVLAATRAGKAVLCEKPIAPTVASARELADELASFEHPPVMVGFQRRYDPSIAKARQLIDEGVIGEVEQVTITSRDPAPPDAAYMAASGGIFADMTIHDFDEARFFLGDIAAVTAIGQNLDPKLADCGDFDGAVVLLRSTTGAAATITNSRHCATGYDQRIEVFGPLGTLNVTNLKPTALEVSTKQASAAQDPYLDFFLERYAEAYRDELTAFIDAINAGTPICPNVTDGVQALVLAEAATESARTGATVQIQGGIS
ncbi:MAG: inositol 2-dehydrogenase [Arachnia propionica]|nr:MAG: inositol 2-dehydrogenase [Arachnia propionica]